MLEIAVAVLGLFCVLLGGFSYQLALKLRQQAELQKERDAMTRIWKKREAQLTRMTTGMLSMVGDLQGIGQGAMGQLENLALLPPPALARPKMPDMERGR